MPKHYMIQEDSIVQTLGDSEKVVVSQKTTSEHINRLEEAITEINNAVEVHDSRIAKDEKRIKNLELGVPSELFVTDSSVAYAKDVPSNALPYAMLTKVGGMTYKDGAILRSAPVTEVEIVGANLFDQDTWCIQHGLTPQEDGSYKGSAVYKTCFTNTHRVSGSIFVSYEGKTDAIKPPVVFLITYTDGTSKYTGELRPTGSFTKTTFVTDATKTVDNIIWTLEERGEFYVKNVRISFVDGEYTPYVKHTLPIPAEVQSLDGYGCGVNAQYNNCIEWNEEKVTFTQKTIRKVFNGTETFGDYTNQYGSITSPIYPYGIAGKENVLDSHGANTVLANTKNIDFKIADYGVSSVDEFRAYLIEQYNAGTPVTVEYAITEPIVVDISDIITDDNYIGVEGGGIITMVNEYGYAVPSEIIYQVKGVSV